MTITLYRPVGLRELELIWDKDMREFPPRLPHQPIFYPVANVEYACQIARDWNTRDETSGFVGYVTAFEVDEDYLSQFEPHTVGSSTHVEYWIPAERLGSFNDALRGLIRLEGGFFGANFGGYVPDGNGLKGKAPAEQFLALYETWRRGTFDATCEISANRKTVFLNWLFWLHHDFSESGINAKSRKIFLTCLEQCWQFSHIEVPLPYDRFAK